MSTEMVKKAENGTSLDVMLRQAEMFVKSGFFPKHVDTKEKAVVIMMKGRELGLPFTEALSKISVIQGVPCTKVETLLGLARSTGQIQDLKIKYFPSESAPQYCEVTITRKGQSPHTSRFGDVEAKSMGLDGRDNYKKQKATMYQWRALAKNLRVTFPDAIGGLYLEEEIAEDVQIAPATEDKPAEVTEYQEPHYEAPQIEAKPTADVADETPEDQLGNYVMPIGKYKGMRLSQVMGEVTDTGKAKGMEYLEWMAGDEKMQKYPDIQATVQRFLKVVNEGPTVNVE